MPDSIAAQSLRAAVYARVSSEEQREGQTIDSQIAELERFAREKGWGLVGVYKDEGWSGALLSRPALDRLRDDAAQRRFDLVLLNDVDRLARDVAHLGIVKRDLERKGVRVVFRKLPQDESPTYNLMVNVLGSFAEFEREMIIDRTRRGRRHKVEVRQQFIGTIASYGYRYVPKDRAAGREGYLEVVPEEAALVRQMYEWVDKESLSAGRVMERLNRSQARPRKGGRWAKSTVLRILRNETYAGVWHYNKRFSSESLKSRGRYKRTLKNSNRLRPREEWLPVILPAELRIVSRDLWQRVQLQLTKNIVFSSRNAKHVYLLKGLVRCGGCGSSFVGDPCHGKFYYRCLRRCRRMPTVREERLDKTVWGAITEAILDPKIILSQVSRLRQSEAEDEQTAGSEAHAVSHALSLIQKEEARLLKAYRTGFITPAQLGRELEQLKQRQSALELRSTSLKNHTAPTANKRLNRTLEEYCQDAAKRIKTFSENERQRFIRLLVDHVVFEGDKVRIRGVIPLSDAAQSERLPVSRMPEEDTKKTGADMITDTNINTFNSSRIGITETDRDGRNTVERNYRIEDTAMYLDRHNEVSRYYSDDEMIVRREFIDYISFEICRALPEGLFSILSDEGLELVRLLKQKWDDPTLRELCDGVQKERGDRVSISAMSRALRRLGMAPARRGPRPTELKRAA
jgi:site-specific DNA recombinase